VEVALTLPTTPADLSEASVVERVITLRRSLHTSRRRHHTLCKASNLRRHSWAGALCARPAIACEGLFFFHLFRCRRGAHGFVPFFVPTHVHHPRHRRFRRLPLVARFVGSFQPRAAW